MISDLVISYTKVEYQVLTDRTICCTIDFPRWRGVNSSEMSKLGKSYKNFTFLFKSRGIPHLSVSSSFFSLSYYSLTCYFQWSMVPQSHLHTQMHLFTYMNTLTHTHFYPCASAHVHMHVYFLWITFCNNGFKL